MQWRIMVEKAEPVIGSLSPFKRKARRDKRGRAPEAGTD